jgi:hypothetical protein
VQGSARLAGMKKFYGRISRKSFFTFARKGTAWLAIIDGTKKRRMLANENAKEPGSYAKEPIVLNHPVCIMRILAYIGLNGYGLILHIFENGLIFVFLIGRIGGQKGIKA